MVDPVLKRHHRVHPRSKNNREEEAAYERLLGDAMIGDGSLFTREDATKRGSWGAEKGRNDRRFGGRLAQSKTQR